MKCDQRNSSPVRVSRLRLWISTDHHDVGACVDMGLARTLGCEFDRPVRPDLSWRTAQTRRVHPGLSGRIGATHQPCPSRRYSPATAVTWPIAVCKNTWRRSATSCARVRESKAVLGPVFSCPRGPKSPFPPPGMTQGTELTANDGKSAILIAIGSRDSALNCAVVEPPVRIELYSEVLVSSLNHR